LAIFEKFARGNKESAIPGVGLGLAICQAIIDVHGGSISAENRPEGGARFVLHFLWKPRQNLMNYQRICD
jgi:two-component system sensor histidine kinase KdpD